MLDQKTIEIIKSTVPVLEEHGLKITKTFYQTMFKNNPELKNVFNQTNQREGRQPHALSQTVYAAAKNIDNLEALIPAIQHIGHKHVSLNIKPEQYPIVGQNLLIAIKEVLQDAATDEIIEAWGKAYGEIAKLFIEMEVGMHNKMMDGNGWDGYKSFVVVDKVRENEVVTSFYLKPVDGVKLPLHEAGQYVTVKVNSDKLEYIQPRQYSLSMEPNREVYRISVKKEEHGLISQILHDQIQVNDTIELTAPAGPFVFKVTSKPVVLMSGGVGITPMMSMAYEAVKGEAPVHFVYSAINSSSHTFKEEVQKLAQKNSNMTASIFYEMPVSTDQLGVDFNVGGRITKDWMEANLPLDAEFYFCGPLGFMKHIYQTLMALGVKEESIHFEIFGPNLDLLQA